MVKNRAKRISAILIATLFITTNTSVIATEITGIRGQNGVYNIYPEAIMKDGRTGYRQYSNFSVDKGDIANLNYKNGKNNINTFVNLVDNKININGIVNSVRDGNYYNGKAVFISPNGMVVGKSGVINVGSFSVNTPDQKKYSQFKNNPELIKYDNNTSSRRGSVYIDGKVITNNNVEINSGTINISENGNILNGSNNLAIIENNEQADALFNNLVNQGDRRSGDIILRSNRGTEVNGSITNNSDGDIVIINSGRNGIVQNGNITNKHGNTIISNQDGGTYISGNISNKGGNLGIYNDGNGELLLEGDLKNYDGETDIINHGTDRLSLLGKVSSDGNINIENTSEEGIFISPFATINGHSDVNITNNGEYGVNIHGKVRASNDINIKNENSSVSIGDNVMNNDNYLRAGNDINIDIKNGNLLNAGTNRTLLNAENNLKINVNNGSIGKEQTRTKHSTTSSWTKRGEWTYKNSINTNVKGKITAIATNPENVNGADINITANNSDLNIETISSDGKITLNATGYNGKGNITNASTEAGTNIQAKDINLTASGNIGSASNKLTFNQGSGEMNVIAKGDIYMKANLDEENKAHNVGNMVSQKGNLDVEFGGNTHIHNVTAEKDINIVTRGKDLTIDNLGELDNEFTYNRNDDTKILPDNVTLKALDINKYARDNNLPHSKRGAKSTVRVANATLDNGTMDITADEIYANGIHVKFNKYGNVKEQDDSTSEVLGAKSTPTAHPVRPEDVEEIGQETNKRHYKKVTEDKIALDKTNLQLDSDTDNDLDIDTDMDTDLDTDTDTDLDIDRNLDTDNDTDIDLDSDLDTDTDVHSHIKIRPRHNTNNKILTQNDKTDGSITYSPQTAIENLTNSSDKRQSMRFDTNKIKTAVSFKNTDNKINKLLDISRGGIAVSHYNKLKAGDILPVNIKYKDIDVNTDIQIVSADEKRAGAKFVNLDNEVANKILYMNIMLEADNDMLITSLKG